MMDGIINVNKPTGMTSHDVVYRLRRILGVKKIGHTGTLDPDASGVLPMCVGKATKLADYLTATDKQYRAELSLGAFTDTQDASGEVLERFDVNVTEKQLRDVLCEFVGEIEQIPPMYSAIKINGKKLYELAREGKTAERAPRRITVHGITLETFDAAQGKAVMTVECSKGTYIRTLCNDIGARLGCGGYMSALERTRSGRFSIEDAYTLERIESMAADGDLGFMIKIGDALAEYEKVILAEKNAYRMCNGIRIFVDGLENDKIYRAFDEKGCLLALIKCGKGGVEVVKAFYGGVQS